ncbi:MAG: hypothetical protein HC857_02770 [Synechococcales cyanobacterium RU_4_20]|nr:hypothetical protein [Synechococcales cyanobacterium RU_4_20]
MIDHGRNFGAGSFAVGIQLLWVGMVDGKAIVERRGDRFARKIRNAGLVGQAITKPR